METILNYMYQKNGTSTFVFIPTLSIMTKRKLRSSEFAFIPCREWSINITWLLWDLEFKWYRK